MCILFCTILDKSYSMYNIKRYLLIPFIIYYLYFVVGWGSYYLMRLEEILDIIYIEVYIYKYYMCL